MADKNGLSKFLSDPNHSTVREYMLTCRVIHDLMVAAAEKYNLLVYIPTVDSDGFDLILDDREGLLPLQLKSVNSNSKTKSWEIHRELLRPKPGEEEWFGLEPSPNGTGRGGGVLLIDCKATKSGAVEIDYSYTDMRILMAFRLGLIKASQVKASGNLFRRLTAEPSGKIRVPRGVFIKVRSPQHLLALMGLHHSLKESAIESNWRYQLDELAKHQFHRNQFSPNEERARRSLLSETLQRLSCAR